MKVLMFSVILYYKCYMYFMYIYTVLFKSISLKDGISKVLVLGNLKYLTMHQHKSILT